METIDYLRALRRSALLVVICVIACLAGAFIAVEAVTPQYSTTASLIVSGGSGVSQTDEISQRQLAITRAAAFSAIAGTRPAISDAVTGAGYPAGTGLPAVFGSAPGSGPFLNITVTSTDRVLAARVADAFVSTLPQTIKRLQQIPGATPITLAVLSPAGIPSKPSSPDRRRDLALGGLLGLILGFAVALLREVTDRTIRDSDSAGAALGITVLGVIPFDSPKEQLVAQTSPRGIRTEAYRQVRTSLIAADQVEGAPPLRRMIATSATAGEGKTSLVANLAKVYARAGHRVAVVDADLRRPRISSFFDLPADAPGLSTVLAGTAGLAEVTVVYDEGRLGVVPSGPIPSNPSEALGALTMDSILDELAAEWDIVLIDTPPVLPVADALILAPKVDGVILVARLGETTVDKLRRARSAIEKVNGQIVGIVPNGAKANDDSAYRYIYGRRNKETASYISVVPSDAQVLPTESTLSQAAAGAEARAERAPGGRRLRPGLRKSQHQSTPPAAAPADANVVAASHVAPPAAPTTPVVRTVHAAPVVADLRRVPAATPAPAAAPAPVVPALVAPAASEPDSADPAPPARVLPPAPGRGRFGYGKSPLTLLRERANK